jgi:hypothetical protein
MADINAILGGLRSELGKRYVWGATGPNTFDCSGLVQYVYGQNGIHLPRTSREQAKVGQTIPKGQQQAGDLVFSSWDNAPGVDHVGVYIGNGQMIVAPHTGDVVKVQNLTPGYMGHVTNIQRVTGITGTAAGAGAATGSGLDPFAGVTAALDGIGSSFATIGGVADTVAKLALPQTWVRIVAGVAGIFLVFFGLWKLVKEVKD